ncbi:unnamed protein product [Heterobilharzia americana]|nr:unnamed protein product [Heterobilharzia americana]
MCDFLLRRWEIKLNLSVYSNRSVALILGLNINSYQFWKVGSIERNVALNSYCLVIHPGVIALIVFAALLLLLTITAVIYFVVKMKTVFLITINRRKQKNQLLENTYCNSKPGNNFRNEKS